MRHAPPPPASRPGVFDDRREALRNTAYLTLDLEADYVTNSFYCLDRIAELVNLLRQEQIPLTVFVEGRVLRDHRHMLECFERTTLFGLHSNDHRSVPDTPAALDEGIQSFRAAFGVDPSGYRAGFYRLSPELIEHLAHRGFAWDASFSPRGACAPGTSEMPFRWPNGLWELPVGRWPGTCIRFAMSMVSLIGLPLTRALCRIQGYPVLPVFVFHLHDIFPSIALRQATLVRKLGHTWNYRLGLADPFARFRRLIMQLRRAGFSFATLNDLYAQVSNDTAGAYAGQGRR